MHATCTDRVSMQTHFLLLCRLIQRIISKAYFSVSILNRLQRNCFPWPEKVLSVFASCKSQEPRFLNRCVLFWTTPPQIARSTPNHLNQMRVCQHSAFQGCMDGICELTPHWIDIWAPIHSCLIPPYPNYRLQYRWSTSAGKGSEKLRGL